RSNTSRRTTDQRAISRIRELKRKTKRVRYARQRCLTHHTNFSTVTGESLMPTKTTTVCAARTNALACNIHELITELEERIEDGEPFDNPKLTRAADCVFDGTRAQGKYTPRDAYDALEIAVNNHLSEKHARELMQMDVSEALASVLRPLVKRLPRKCDSTLKRSELQQFTTPPTL